MTAYNNMSRREIIAEIRADLKTAFGPTYTFSVRQGQGSYSINVDLVAGPGLWAQVVNTGSFQVDDRYYRGGGYDWDVETTTDLLNTESFRRAMEVTGRDVPRVDDAEFRDVLAVAREIEILTADFEAITRIANRNVWNDSDVMTDYFSYNALVFVGVRKANGYEEGPAVVFPDRNATDITAADVEPVRLVTAGRGVGAADVYYAGRIGANDYSVTTDVDAAVILPRKYAAPIAARTGCRMEAIDVVETVTAPAARTIEQLEAAAMTQYDIEAKGGSCADWSALFTHDELTQLWALCMLTDANLWGRAYDDEVYDALNSLGHFDDDVDEAPAVEATDIDTRMSNDRTIYFELQRLSATYGVRVVLAETDATGNRFELMTGNDDQLISVFDERHGLPVEVETYERADGTLTDAHPVTVTDWIGWTRAAIQLA